MAVEVRLLDDEVRDDSARAWRLESRPRIGRSLAHCRDLALTLEHTTLTSSTESHAWLVCDEGGRPPALSALVDGLVRPVYVP